MGRFLRLIHETPNIENTIPSEVYQVSSPADFSLEDDDKYVLHSGGTNYRAFITRNDAYGEIQLSQEVKALEHQTLSLFVLNTALILWLNESNIGLEIPYQYIVMSSLLIDGNTSELYLHILSNEFICCIPRENVTEVVTVELKIIQDENKDPHSLPVVQNSKNRIEDLYEAISVCSALHYDTDSSTQSQEQQFFTAASGVSDITIPASWYSNDAQIPNVGDADDLTQDDQFHASPADSQEEDAAMNVMIKNPKALGSRRSLDSSEPCNSKVRRLE